MRTPKLGGMANYQAHDDLHVLKRHAEIVASPKRHTAAKNLAASEAKKLMTIKNPLKK